MGERLIEAVVAIATAVIGLAIIAVLVGRQSETYKVISTAGGALSSIIRSAVAPVSGGIA